MSRPDPGWLVWAGLAFFVGLAATGRPVLAGGVLAVVVLALALVRLVLPRRVAGSIAVRSRTLDVLTLAVLGGLLALGTALVHGWLKG